MITAGGPSSSSLADVVDTIVDKARLSIADLG